MKRGRKIWSLVLDIENTSSNLDVVGSNRGSARYSSSVSLNRIPVEGPFFGKMGSYVLVSQLGAKQAKFQQIRAKCLNLK